MFSTLLSLAIVFVVGVSAVGIAGLGMVIWGASQMSRDMFVSADE